jgi:putative hydroxymethylpyrimidine transport system substrate-binding protein
MLFAVQPHSGRRTSTAIRRWLLVLSFLVLATPLASPRSAVGSQELTKVTVALDWYPNVDHAGLFLAKERGYFADEGLDVELYTPADPSVVLQTVGAGKDTFGISYQTDLLLARAQGVPVVSTAALVQRPLMGVMSLREKGIVRPRDLVGKTIGYPGIPSQEAFLATMLETDGASLADVDLVNVGFDLVPAVVSGRVDAVMGAFWTVEPLLAEQAGHPVNLLHVEDWGVPSYYELILAASEKTVQSHPGTVKAFLRAILRGYEAATTDPSAAIDALARASPEIDRAVETKGLALLTPAWTEGVPVFGTQTKQRWDAYATWMKARHLLPADLDVDAAYTTVLLPQPRSSPSASPSA